MTLTSNEQKEFLNRGFSRRSLARIAAMVTAGAALPFYNEPALAQLSKVDNVPADAVQDIVTRGLPLAMNKFNKKQQTQKPAKSDPGGGDA